MAKNAGNRERSRIGAVGSAFKILISTALSVVIKSDDVTWRN